MQVREVRRWKSGEEVLLGKCSPTINPIQFQLFIHQSMSALRLQQDASIEQQDLSAELSDIESSSQPRPGKNTSRPGRPKGKGRPKRTSRVLNKRKSEQEQQWQQRGRVKERVNAKEESSIEGYVRIIDYLKKIDYEEGSCQNKMNPYNALTPTCFWYAVGAEYYSFDFFARNNPHDTAMEILERVHKIPHLLPLRVMKYPQEHTKLPFESQELRTLGQEMAEKMSVLVPAPLPSKPEIVQRRTMLSGVGEDDQFISSTRAMVYNYLAKKVKSSEKWQGLMSSYTQQVETLPEKEFEKAEDVEFEAEEEPLKQTNLFDLLRQQAKKKVQKRDKKKKDVEIFQQEQKREDKVEECEHVKDKSIEQKQEVIIEEKFQATIHAEPIIVQPQQKMEEQADHAQLIKQQKEPIDEEADQTVKEELEPNLPEFIEQEIQEKSHTFSQKQGAQQLLLDGILHMPIDKIISILQSSLPTAKLPEIHSSFMPLPTKDPLEFVYQLHPEQQVYLQYMKAYRKRLYRQKVAKAEVEGEEQEREGQFQDAKCQICTDGDYTDDNLIVFCSMCNISLHQRCVGLAKVPAESWICDVCLAFGPAGINLPCPLCNVKGGAMKRTSIHIDATLFRQTNPSYYQYSRRCPYNKQKEEYIPKERVEGQSQAGVRVVRERGERQEDCYYDYFVKATYPSDQPACHYVWVHYVCAIWVPECYFEQKNGVISVKGIENIEKKRFKNECLVCRKTRAGAAVKCQEAECEKYYHPECARKKRVYMEQLNLQKLKYLIFCEEHEPLKLTRQIQYKKKKSREEIIKFARMVEKYVETYRIAQFPFKLMKAAVSNPFLDTAPRPVRDEPKDTRQSALASDEDFLKDLILKLSKAKMMTVQMEKVENGYRITNIETPSKRQIRKCLNRYDQFWSSIKNGESNQQNFRRYERIMLQNQRLREKLEYFLSGSVALRGKGDQKKVKKVGRKRGKHAVQQVETLIEQQGGIFCICKKPYEGESDMFECQVCTQWYHFKCLGFIGSEEDAQNMEFTCMKCMKFENPEKKKIRLQKYSTLFSPDSILYNYRPPTPELMSQQEVEQKNYTEIIEEAKRSKQYLLASPAKQEEHNQHQQQLATQMQLKKQTQQIQNQPEQLQTVSALNAQGTAPTVPNQSATAIEIEPKQPVEKIQPEQPAAPSIDL